MNRSSYNESRYFIHLANPTKHLKLKQVGSKDRYNLICNSLYLITKMLTTTKEVASIPLLGRGGLKTTTIFHKEWLTPDG